MSKEIVPLTIYYHLVDELDGKAPLPRCTTIFDGNTLSENTELDNPSNVTFDWQEGRKVSVKEYMIEINDDINEHHTLEILLESKRNEEMHNCGFFVKDIQLGRVSLEYILPYISELTANICPESEFKSDGFIAYLRKANMLHEISIVNGHCHWKSSMEQKMINVGGCVFTLNFRTPIYMWLMDNINTE
jgi:hypothetical protein